MPAPRQARYLRPSSASDYTSTPTRAAGSGDFGGDRATHQRLAIPHSVTTCARPPSASARTAAAARR